MDTRTRDVEWRVRQLKSLLKFYDDNSDLFVDAIRFAFHHISAPLYVIRATNK
jgi:hypothetical protein